MRRSILALFALSTAALLACGGSQPAPSQPVSEDRAAPSAEPAEAGAPESPQTTADAGATPTVAETDAPKFDDLPKDQKVEVMATKVVPNVGKLFKEHNGKKFEKFGCQTCHGPQKKEDPRKVLPKLTLSNGGFEKLSKSKPEMMKFMGEQVVPAMAAALGEKPYDPATKQGFGCAGCHTVN